MGIVIYIIISIIIFFLCVAVDDENGLGNALVCAIFWPLALVYLGVSLFWGAGKYL